MRSLAILAICGLVGFWVYTKFQLDNRYYDSLTKNGEEHTILERAAFALQREYDLEISKDVYQVAKTLHEGWVQLKSRQQKKEPQQQFQAKTAFRTRG